MARLSMRATTTTNGAGALTNTGSRLVDLFSTIGASRNDLEGVRKRFDAAYKVDPLKAAAILLYARDIRHNGAGERQVFRTILKDMAGSGRRYTSEILNLIAEVGRFDDFQAVYDTAWESTAVTIWADAIKERNVLAAKWAKREDKVLQRALGLNEAGLRKLLASIRKDHIVETKMCSKNWTGIDFSKLPSVAGMRYAKAFGRNDGVRYSAFITSKETKVNASTSYPHDVYRMYKYGNERAAAGKYWVNLPDLGCKGNILPIIDTSSSMNATASGVISCLDVSVSLGTYLAQQIVGKFQNMCISFNSTPKLHQLPVSDDPCKVLDFVKNIDWGGSTNLQKTYELVLDSAKKLHCDQDDMPEYLMILSDMQFNTAIGNGTNGYYVGREVVTNPRYAETLYGDMQKKFAAAGYKMPKVIFWNLNAEFNNQPVASFQADTALIGGFSPNIIKAVLSCEDVVITPESIMENAIAPFIEMLQK